VQVTQQLDRECDRALKDVPSGALQVHTHEGNAVRTQQARFEEFFQSRDTIPLSVHPALLSVLEDGLGHTPYCVEATRNGKTCGLLMLSYVSSLLFGRFLVSLPYVNYGGMIVDDRDTQDRLLKEACSLAERLDVRYLEVRHAFAGNCSALSKQTGHKVHMQLELPGSSDVLWTSLLAKVRNQVRKGQKGGLTVCWGGKELLREFYAVFSLNMRDLGTPVYGQKLFRGILERFPDRAELCVVRTNRLAIAAALLLHGRKITEVPSACSLRLYNHTCANMLMYWHLLERAVQRGQAVFDFGRSSPESNTYRFKKQWGAEAIPAEWHYFVRTGSAMAMRPENPKYSKLIRVWQRLPVWLTRLLGPVVVRGIP